MTISDTYALWGRRWTPEEMADIVCPVMEAPDWNAINCVAIGLAESGGYEWATNLVDHNPDASAFLSLDLGIWQTNTFWHPNLGIRDAYTPEVQIVYVEKIAKKEGEWGYDWSLWVTWKNGAYKQFLGAAREAVNAWRQRNDLEPI